MKSEPLAKRLETRSKVAFKAIEENIGAKAREIGQGPKTAEALLRAEFWGEEVERRRELLLEALEGVASAPKARALELYKKAAEEERQALATFAERMEAESK
jgi:hypothetical protein